MVANHGIDRRKERTIEMPSPHSSETALLNPVAPKMFDENGNGIYPMLLDWIEWEGPIVTKEEHKKRAEVIPPESANGEEVAGFLQGLPPRMASPRGEGRAQTLPSTLSFGTLGG